eukprot:g3278.t1
MESGEEILENSNTTSTLSNDGDVPDIVRKIQLLCTTGLGRGSARLTVSQLEKVQEALSICPHFVVEYKDVWTRWDSLIEQLVHEVMPKAVKRVVMNYYADDMEREIGVRLVRSAVTCFVLSAATGDVRLLHVIQRIMEADCIFYTGRIDYYTQVRQGGADYARACFLDELSHNVQARKRNGELFITSGFRVLLEHLVADEWCGADMAGSILNTFNAGMEANSLPSGFANEAAEAFMGRMKTLTPADTKLCVKANEKSLEKPFFALEKLTGGVSQSVAALFWLQHVDLKYYKTDNVVQRLFGLGEFIWWGTGRASKSENYGRWLQEENYVEWLREHHIIEIMFDKTRIELALLEKGKKLVTWLAQQVATLKIKNAFPESWLGLMWDAALEVSLQAKYEAVIGCLTAALAILPKHFTLKMLRHTRLQEAVENDDQRCKVMAFLEAMQRDCLRRLRSSKNKEIKARALQLVWRLLWHPAYNYTPPSFMLEMLANLLRNDDEACQIYVEKCLRYITGSSAAVAAMNSNELGSINPSLLIVPPSIDVDNLNLNVNENENDTKNEGMPPPIPSKPKLIDASSNHSNASTIEFRPRSLTSFSEPVAFENVDTAAALALHVMRTGIKEMTDGSAPTMVNSLDRDYKEAGGLLQVLLDELVAFIRRLRESKRVEEEQKLANEQKLAGLSDTGKRNDTYKMSSHSQSSGDYSFGNSKFEFDTKKKLKRNYESEFSSIWQDSGDRETKESLNDSMTDLVLFNPNNVASEESSAFNNGGTGGSISVDETLSSLSFILVLTEFSELKLSVKNLKTVWNALSESDDPSHFSQRGRWMREIYKQRRNCCDDNTIAEAFEKLVCSAPPSFLDRVGWSCFQIWFLGINHHSIARDNNKKILLVRERKLNAKDYLWRTILEASTIVGRDAEALLLELFHRLASPADKADEWQETVERVLRCLLNAAKFDWSHTFLHEKSKKEDKSEVEKIRKEAILHCKRASTSLRLLKNLLVMCENTYLGSKPHRSCVRGDELILHVDVTRRIPSSLQGINTSNTDIVDANLRITLHANATLGELRDAILIRMNPIPVSVRIFLIQGTESNRREEKRELFGDNNTLVNLGLYSGVVLQAQKSSTPPFGSEVGGEFGDGTPASDQLAKNEAFIDALFNLLEMLHFTDTKRKSQKSSLGDVANAATNLQSICWNFLMLMPTNVSMLESLKIPEKLNQLDYDIYFPYNMENSEKEETETIESVNYRGIYALQIINSLLMPAEKHDIAISRALQWRRQFLKSGGFERVMHFFMRHCVYDKKSQSIQPRSLAENDGLAVALRVVQFLVTQGWGHEETSKAEDVDLETNELSRKFSQKSISMVTKAINSTKLLSRLLDVLNSKNVHSGVRVIACQTVQTMSKTVWSQNNELKDSERLLHDVACGSMLTLLLKESNRDIRHEVMHLLDMLCRQSKDCFRRVIEQWMIILKDVDVTNAVLTKTCGNFFDFLYTPSEDLFESISSRGLLGSNSNSTRLTIPAKIVNDLFSLGFDKLSSYICHSKSGKPEGLLKGLLQLLRGVIECGVHREKVNFDANNLEEVIVTVFSWCLFKVPQLSDTRQTLCSSTSSRRAAFDLLLAIGKVAPSLLITQLRMVEEFLKSAPDPSTSGFEYRSSLHLRAKSSKRVGLKNQGNTCYMNSLVQQFFMSPALRQGILDAELPDDDDLTTKLNSSSKSQNESKTEETKKVNIAPVREMQKTFMHLKEGLIYMYDPKSLVDACADLGMQSPVYHQNDATEFCIKILNRMEDVFKGTPSYDTLRWHFGGKTTRQSIRMCGNNTKSSEKFYLLTLAISGKSSIPDALDGYVESTMMEGANRLECDCQDEGHMDMCHGGPPKAGEKIKVDGFNRHCLESLPNLLVLHLKRFDFDFNTLEQYKLNSRCSFPFTLNMRKYTREYLEAVDAARAAARVASTNVTGTNSDSNHADSKFLSMSPVSSPELSARKTPNVFDDGSVENDPAYDYALKGIVVHAGTPTGGHYYSIINDSNGKWLKFNDDRVTEFSKNKIAEECYGGGKATDNVPTAFMLMYERIHPQPPPSEECDGNENELGRRGKAATAVQMKRLWRQKSIDSFEALAAEAETNANAVKDDGTLNKRNGDRWRAAVWQSNDSAIRQSLMFDGSFFYYSRQVIKLLDNSRILMRDLKLINSLNNENESMIMKHSLEDNKREELGYQQTHFFFEVVLRGRKKTEELRKWIEAIGCWLNAGKPVVGEQSTSTNREKKQSHEHLNEHLNESAHSNSDD